jgi:hypothetical protein
MKNNLLITALIIAFSTSLKAQIIKTNDDNYRAKSYKNDYYLNYLNNDDFVDLRTAKSGDKAFTFMYLFTFEDIGLDVDWSSDSSNIISTGENLNRIAEKFVPNYKYYLNDKSSLTFGLIYSKNRAKMSQSYVDSLNTNSSYDALDHNNLDELKQSQNFARLSMRVAYDYHFKFFRRKWFDLDPYIGASFNVGKSTKKEIIEQTFKLDPDSASLAADFQNLKIKENYLCLGGDIYFGVNFRFERFSIGAEVLAIGFNRQSGYGSRKVSVDQSVAGVSAQDEYYENIDDPVSAGGPAFNNLDFSSVSTSMYRGIRMNFTFYLR